MRDHLLGCHQFQAVESSDDYEHYGCGVPRRVLDAQRPQLRGVSKEEDFERRDKTPVSMRADFPHEYDLHTMYADAAQRSYNEQRKNWLYGDFEPLDRLLSRSGKPVWIGVDPARPGSDRTAVATRVLMEQASKELDSICGALAENIAYAQAHAPRTAAESRAEIVARILADKQRLRPGKKPLALDL